LTTREQDTARLVMVGLSDKEIARELAISATTVRTHVLALRRKTGHASLAALVQTLARLPPVAPATLAARPASPR
jgi:DNA-binding CsgD family transcriptional regulator